MTAAGMAARSSQPEVRLLEGGRAEARAVQPGDRTCVSRSYSGSYAVVAWYDGQVGIDLEAVTPLSSEFCLSACTPEEGARMSGADPAAITSLWSSKEALAKALGDALDYDPRRLGSPVFWPGGVAGRWRARPLSVPDGYVGWICWSI